MGIRKEQITESNILNVDADGLTKYSTIIDALADAVDGDIIIVGPGTYSGRIVLPNVDVTIMARSMLARGTADGYKTIIEHTFSAAEANQGVIEPSSTGSAVFVGVEISLIHATTSNQACFHAQANANLHVFKSCRFRQDGTGGSGGGMYGVRVNANMDIQLEDCEFATPTNVNGSAHQLIAQGPATTATARVVNCRFAGDVSWTAVNSNQLEILNTDVGGTMSAADTNVNVDGSCRFGTLSGTVKDRIFNGSASTPPVAQARRTSSLAVPAGFADIAFDTTDIENDSAVIDHDDVTNTDRITVKETGLYRVTLQGFLATAATLAEARFRLRVNDTTVVDGSDFGIKAGTDGNEMSEFSRTVYCSCTADDFLSWQANDNGVTGGTVQIPCIFTVEALISIIGPTGPAGANGAPGADGDITWDGAWITANPYTTNEAVTHNGSSYVCTAGHTSGASTEPGVGGSWTTVWDLMAAKGDTGPSSTSQIVEAGPAGGAVTSSTNILIPGMTITPASGTYMVWFSALITSSSKTVDPFFSIYSGGSIESQSERAITGDAYTGATAGGTMARVTVNGSQAIEARARTPSGTVTFFNRQLMIIKT